MANVKSFNRTYWNKGNYSLTILENISQFGHRFSCQYKAQLLTNLYTRTLYQWKLDGYQWILMLKLSGTELILGMAILNGWVGMN